jgi:hypothetical protein
MLHALKSPRLRVAILMTSFLAVAVGLLGTPARANPPAPGAPGDRPT